MILSAIEISKRLHASGCINDRSDDSGSDIPAHVCHSTAASACAGDKTIHPVQADGLDLIITPFSRECLQPASYDLRVAHDQVLPRGACSLVSTLEWVELPVDLAATLRCRSSFGRKGLLIAAGFVDPGFRGQLTLCLVNMGAEEVPLYQNNRVVQMIIHEVKGGNRLYDGNYQDSYGAIHSREWSGT
ncbi:MAG: dCTP deaminase [Methanomicrobiales archaeon]